MQGYIEAKNGADQVSAGGADHTLVRFPAADNLCDGVFSFHVPQNIDSGKSWYILVTFFTPTGADSATFNYYLSAYQASTTYAGWNLSNGASFGTLTSASAWTRFEYEKSIGAVIEAGDIVSFDLRKTSTDTRDFHVVGVALYWR